MVGLNTIVILTAIPEEYRAVTRLLLDDARTILHPEDGTRLLLGALPGTPWQIAVGRIGPGTHSAALVTASVYKWLKPAAVFFVGVAGALKSDIELGDVVVATKIYHVQSGKETPEGFVPYPGVGGVSWRLGQAANRLLESDRWYDLVPEEIRSRRTPPKSVPTVHFKPVAVGDVVLDSPDAALAEMIRRVYADAAAIEMESFGLASAAALNDGLQILTIRSISDRADGAKSAADSTGSQTWAAAHAAAAAAAVIAAYTPPETAPSEGGPGGSVTALSVPDIRRNPGQQPGRESAPAMPALCDEVAGLLARAEPARAPILIALDTEEERLTDDEFLTTERHLTVTLRAERVMSMAEAARHALHSAGSIDEVVEAGRRIWTDLVAAQSRLPGLLRRMDTVGPAQPVAWCGRSELLALLRAPLLIAHTGTEGVDDFLSVRTGGHYFMPVHAARENRDRYMKQRAPGRQAVLRCVDLRNAGQDPSPELFAEAAAAESVVVVDPDHTSSALSGMIRSVRSAPLSPTRAVFAFGGTVPDAGTIDGFLDTVPFLSVADRRLAEPELTEALEAVIREHAATRAVPCLVAAVRAALIRQAHSRGDVAGCLLALGWSAWSWVGLPLFARRYDAVAPAAYPHLRDLRNVASGGRYFNRRKDIVPAYEAGALARDSSEANSFHLYLSGAGGTGKSSLLQAVHDLIGARDDAIAVWYRVDSPGSLWDDIQRRVQEETVRAIEQKLGASATGLVPEGGADLGGFLRETVKRLRERQPEFKEIAVFVDQLERTFESGDEPDFAALDNISGELMGLLNTVRVGEGVRVFVASRKQYLPDFLGSTRTAKECGFEFNVLQTIADSRERVLFVRRLLVWCETAELVERGLRISDDAARTLMERVNGHPLDATLALIQLLSTNPKGEITRADVRSRRPWEHLFDLDLLATDRDELDRHFLLAMAHARTEIVHFEGVWWRLRMVSAKLARWAEDLGPSGVLERLWLFGHLGRTIHLRPHAGDPAHFVEFFHANLRDHLLRDVMARGGRDGTPAAWRALDALSSCARDWEQTQRLLSNDDVNALMEHRTVVVEPQSASVEAPDPLRFHLLFLRDRGTAREKLCQAAMECFVFSALVHENFGRWAFETLYPDIGRRVGLCKRWLSVCPPRARPAVLRYLVEAEGEGARDALASLVRGGADPLSDDMAAALAAILDEPLYAARYRNQVVAALLRSAAHDAGGDLDRLPSRVKSLIVAACEADGDTLRQVLAYCHHVLGGASDPMVRTLAVGLGSASLVDSWTADRATDGGKAGTDPGERLPEAVTAPLGLAAGEVLRATVKKQIPVWTRELRERLGVPLPELQLVTGDCDEYELELSSRRGRVSTSTFHPDHHCVLKRHWEASGRTGHPEAREGYDDVLGEDLLWLPETALTGAEHRFAVRDFDTAVLDWLEGHCRRSIGQLFDMDLLVGLIRELSTERGGLGTEISLEAWRLRQVVVDLIEEDVPFAARRQVIFDELARLTPEIQQPETLVRRIRQRIRADICRSLADESGRLTTFLLDEQLEQEVIDSMGTAGDRTVLGLDPVRAEQLAAAVRRHARGIRESGHRPPPVLVTPPPLRHPLARLLGRFDDRIRVLAITELDPEAVDPVRGGIVEAPWSPKADP